MLLNMSNVSLVTDALLSYTILYPLLDAVIALMSLVQFIILDSGGVADFVDRMVVSIVSDIINLSQIVIGSTVSMSMSISCKRVAISIGSLYNDNIWVGIFDDRMASISGRMWL